MIVSSVELFCEIVRENGVLKKSSTTFLKPKKQKTKVSKKGKTDYLIFKVILKFQYSYKKSKHE